jgi:hypothetical protein
MGRAGEALTNIPLVVVWWIHKIQSARNTTRVPDKQTKNHPRRNIFPKPLQKALSIVLEVEDMAPDTGI